MKRIHQSSRGTCAFVSVIAGERPVRGATTIQVAASHCRAIYKSADEGREIKALSDACVRSPITLLLLGARATTAPESPRRHAAAPVATSDLESVVTFGSGSEVFERFSLTRSGFDRRTFWFVAYL
jgi:hypothetical protein